MDSSNSVGAQLQNLQNHGSSLADVFEFTTEDLVANQAGIVTDRQREQLKNDGYRYQKTNALIIGGVFVLAILGTVFLPGESVRQLIGTQPGVAVAALGIIAIGYLVYLADTFLSASRAGTGDIKVTVANGIPKLIGRPVFASGTAYQRVKIGQCNPVISATQAGALVTGTTYRAYLGGKGRMAKILSIETI